MKRSFLILLIVMGISSCGIPEWTEFRGTKGLGKASTAIQPPLVTKWEFQLQEQPQDRRFFNQPLVEGHTLFFGSADGNFYSFDINSGYMNWSYRTNGPINAVGTIIKDKVLIGSGDGAVYCLNKETGTLDWTFQTRGGVNSTLVPWKDGVMVASDTDAFYYLNLDGQLDFSLPNPTWIRNSFQIRDDIMAFSPGAGAHAHDLSVYDLNEQRPLWYIDTSNFPLNWFSFPSMDRGQLHYAAAGFNGQEWIFQFNSVNVRTGNVRWRRVDTGIVPTNDSFNDSVQLFYEQSMLLDYEAPLLLGDQVIYATGDYVLRSFKRLTGRDNWKMTFDYPIATAPTLAGGYIYFGLRADDSIGISQLVCVDPRKQKVLWQIPIEGTILNSPVIAGSWIIFGTDKGKFFILEEVF
ncbi:PQQ-binding-like beta-propeller repeat protein [Spirochaeta cellobiosiphila]|uniref:outer membrane protein assembly factor BamB family protein n=1 Tax=Spirochaeta cellobiosiphila TaxID=504483 RepID=UPI00040235FE|nr:PQQ-binding-like beta-propeller repeat protein [Spirochaeta cellobiosiphila]